MCISKTQTFEYKGTAYPREDWALRAAIEDIVANPGFARIICENATALRPYIDRLSDLQGEPARD